jgi:hypothetical protein
MTRVPPTLRRFLIPASVLVDSQQMLRERGELGLEAVVLWIGELLDATTADILAAVRPGQIAYRGEEGCAVEVPPEALSELVAALPRGVFVLARLHTHPGVAYHSEVDDTNMLISHDRAISIVVPHFARAQLDLSSCSVNELRHGQGWVELSPAEVAERFVVR